MPLVIFRQTQLFLCVMLFDIVKAKGTMMQKIILKENTLGLKVLINGIPNLNLAPKEEVESVVSVLEEKITEQYKNKERENK